MNKYKRLLNNSLLFAVGNLGSKLLGFVMVPFYTRVLTTADFGTADFVTTLVNLFTPIVTLSAADAVFRFTMEKANSPSKVLTNGLVISLGSLLVAGMIFPFFKNIPNIGIMFSLTFIGALVLMFQEFARAVGKVTIFAFTGILITAVTVISNILLLFVRNYGLNGYLCSMVIAQIAALVYLIFILKAWRYLKFSMVSFNFIKILLLYGIPLMPNTLSWWLSSAASRVFVVAYAGVAANGIYAVANKVPSLISMLYTIFTQAWQMSAVEEFKSKNNSIFYSKIFNMTMNVLFIGISAIVAFDKLFVRILAAPDYFSAWQIVPFLGLAVLYTSLSSFLGTTYIAALRTKGILFTTILGAIVNVVLNFIFTPKYGAIGAAVSSAIAFLLVMAVRLWDTKKFVNIQVRWTFFLWNHVLLASQICVLYLWTGDTSQFLLIILFLVMLVYNVKPLYEAIFLKK